MAKIQQTCLLVKLLQISFCQTATDCRNHMCFVFSERGSTCGELFSACLY